MPPASPHATTWPLCSCWRVQHCAGETVARDMLPKTHSTVSQAGLCATCACFMTCDKLGMLQHCSAQNVSAMDK